MALQDKIFTLDARGLNCPEPVIQTKRLFDQGNLNRFVVVVDNEVSKENVARFARNQGAVVELSQDEALNWKLDIRIDKPGAQYEEKEPLIPCPIPDYRTSAQKTVVYIGTNIMGKGDDELGAKLMRGFLRTLIDVTPYPWRMLFINSGVKLTTVDQEAVEAIGILEERGVEILSCGTCLDTFGLADQLKLGKVTNMYEVVESLNTATKVISPD
ncbi:MAG: sulfurtransferase-like selenium metabolism protein YedF [Deltaproteobacteria bacterium]|nr:sulfurtransferase-like selenium metabolism protein YedF [Deltaproteobacteria bacterium]